MSEKRTIPPPGDLRLFLSRPHDCGYLPGRQAATLFVDPEFPMTPGLYDIMLEQGFRRSGPHVYRPYCQDCDQCIPARIAAADFHLNRSLRRVWNANQDLRIILQPGLPATHQGAYFDLYRRYLSARHKGGPMDNPTFSSFDDFFASRWSNTHFYEFHLGRTLVMVAVVDMQPRSLSAFYTFFAPELPQRSLGTMGILWQIAQAVKLGKPWVYLGYWIPQCDKMSYKQRFRPLQIFRDKRWVILPPGSTTPPEGLSQATSRK
ncbi:MAG: arginyltransferase [Magnetococcus sp. WYHC-3]